MAGTRDDRQGSNGADDEIREGPPLARRLHDGWAGLPHMVRRGLGWVVIAVLVTLIFTLASLPAWWPL